MTSTSSENISSKQRIRQQLRAVCEILSNEPDGLRVGEVIERLKSVMPPTERELTRNASGYERYDTNVRWWSVDLAKAGWIRKEKGVWFLQPEGRQALQDYPDPQAFGEEANRLYKLWKSAQNAAKESRDRWRRADELVARMPAGSWSTFTDLSVVTGAHDMNLGKHLWTERPAGWHRVLTYQGLPSADRYGDEDRADEQRRLLMDEGLTLDPAADATKQLSVEELRGLAGASAVGRRAWMIRGSSVLGEDLTSSWYSEGFVSLAATHLRPLDAPYDPEAIRASVEEGYSNLGYSKREDKVRDFRVFLTRVSEGDLVLSSSGGEVALGEVSGAPEFVTSDGGRSNLRRSVTWLTADSPADFTDLPPELAGLMKATTDVIDLTEAIDAIEALLPPDETNSEEPVEIAEVTLPLLSEEQSEALLVDRSWLDEFVELLGERRQVILYGPPGTGKTYLAQKVAEAIAPPENVRLAQFHPSYSYEDFFEGYRPVLEEGRAGFRLKSGPLRRIADAALEQRDQPFVLIIDEINRANLAKVFGELYFLLEYRKESIDLLYSEDDAKQFRLPSNLYLIGTMNTADRSIALVDSAMRRRFAFLSLHPDDSHMSGVLRQWLSRERLSTRGADLLDELNSRIPDKEFKIGPSYLMRESAGTQEGVERIWRTSILPLLEEFHYGESIDVHRTYGIPALGGWPARPAAPDEGVAQSEGDGSLAPDGQQVKDEA